MFSPRFGVEILAVYLFDDYLYNILLIMMAMNVVLSMST